MYKVDSAGTETGLSWEICGQLILQNTFSNYHQARVARQRSFPTNFVNCKRHKEFCRFAKLNQNSQCYLVLFENLNYARCYTMNNFQFICKEQFLWSEILIFLLQVSMLKNYQFVERNLPVSVIRNFKFLFRKTVRFNDQKLSISFF